jgi:hypothetical protein
MFTATVAALIVIVIALTFTKKLIFSPVDTSIERWDDESPMMLQLMNLYDVNPDWEKERWEEDHPHGVQMFENEKYEGKFIALDMGMYNVSALQDVADTERTGITYIDDFFSSLKILPQTGVTLYENDNFTGETADIRNYTTWQMWGLSALKNCPFKSSNGTWDKSISSIKVYKVRDGEKLLVR